RPAHASPPPAAPDLVIGSLTQEAIRLVALMRRDVDAGTPHPAHLRSLAGLSRVLDAHLTAHHLQKPLRGVSLELSRCAWREGATRVAPQLTARGLPISADDLLRLVDQASDETRDAVRRLMASGQLVSITADACDAMAADIERRWPFAGIGF